MTKSKFIMWNSRISVSVVEPACAEYEMMKSKIVIESECRQHAEEYAFKVSALCDGHSSDIAPTKFQGSCT